MTEDGWVFFVDRSVDIIKHKGYRVAAAKVESALQEHEQVVGACVVGIPDSKVGERVKAVVVTKEDAQGLAALASLTPETRVPAPRSVTAETPRCGRRRPKPPPPSPRLRHRSRGSKTAAWIPVLYPWRDPWPSAPLRDSPHPHDTPSRWKPPPQDKAPAPPGPASRGYSHGECSATAPLGAHSERVRVMPR